MVARIDRATKIPSSVGRQSLSTPTSIHVRASNTTTNIATTTSPPSSTLRHGTTGGGIIPKYGTNNASLVASPHHLHHHHPHSSLHQSSYPTATGHAGTAMSGTGLTSTTAVAPARRSPLRARVVIDTTNRNYDTTTNGRDPPPSHHHHQIHPVVVSSTDHVYPQSHSPRQHQPHLEDATAAMAAAAAEPVCEYDTNATVLYELLESSNWEKARSRCRSHPEEVRTWIVRKDRSLHVRWKLLPLHAAIIFQSPNFLVSALLEKYPQAASRKDDQGMLPLHLAFRHKQEDEDLLELLLIQYPKGVMIKDRRDRVPLEHGRDCKFSAKLMRLYADAMVASCRLSSNNNNNNNNHAAGANQFGKVDSPTAQTSLMTSLASSTHQHYQQQQQKQQQEYEQHLSLMEGEYEGKIASLQTSHEEQINKLREQHSAVVQAIKDEHNRQLQQQRTSNEQARVQVSNQHKEELGELRDLLTNQVNKGKSLADALESEIAHLQVAMQESCSKRDHCVAENHRLISSIDELLALLRTVRDEQEYIRTNAAQQQNAIQAARSVRQELINSLLQREDVEAENEIVRTSKLIQATDTIRNKIDRAIEHHKNLGVAVLSDGPSRLERERRIEEVLSAEQQLQHQQPKQIPEIYYVGEGNSINNENANIATSGAKHYFAADGGIESKEEVDVYSELDKPRPKATTTDAGYGDVRILGDDISAITDNSDY